MYFFPFHRLCLEFLFMIFFNFITTIHTYIRIMYTQANWVSTLAFSYKIWAIFLYDLIKRNNMVTNALWAGEERKTGIILINDIPTYHSFSVTFPFPFRLMQHLISCSHDNDSSWWADISIAHVKKLLNSSSDMIQNALLTIHTKKKICGNTKKIWWYPSSFTTQKWSFRICDQRSGLSIKRGL